MVFRIKIDLTEIPKALEKGVAGAVLQREAFRCVDEVGTVIRTTMVKVSKTDTGIMRAGWILTPAMVIRKKVVGRVTNSTIAAIVQQKGAKPHFPPPANLNGWVRRQLRISDPKEIRRVSGAISRKIGRTGLKRKRTFSKALKAVGGVIDSVGRECESRIAKLL